MTYTSDEQSVASGAPIELYEFIDNSSGERWRYNTTSETVAYGSYDYLSGIIDRKTIERTGNFVDEALDVSVERGNDLASDYISGTPEGMVALTVYRGHGSNFITIWRGYVETCEFDANGIPTFKCSPRTSFNSGAGKRRRCQRLCDHNLYEYGCNVNQEAFRVDGTITNISGTTITSSAFAGYSDGWFEGGKIVVGNAIRFIRSHTTNTIIVSRIMPSAEMTDTFRAYPGCDKLAATCSTKFSNKLNFGGEENLPVKNPFTHSLNNMSA